MVTILTRTGNRPIHYMNLVSSIKQQTKEPIHLKSNDNPHYNYLSQEKNVFPVIPHPEKGNGFYNLYLNKLISKVDHGWIIILDDDSKMIDNTFIDKLSCICNSTPHNEIIIFQTYIGKDKRVIPNDVSMKRNEIKMGNIDMACFCAHFSVFEHVKFDAKRFGDFNVLRKLKQKGFLFNFVRELPIGIWANYEGDKKGKSNVSLMTRALQHVRLEPAHVIWDVNPKGLTCVIVEPRNHYNLIGALYNMANIYANTDVGLTIYHSQNNAHLIADITNDWTGMKLVCLPQDNLKIKEYSELLTTVEFYKANRSSHVLIFQTDSCIFQKIPEEYFQYDYVGAPWRKQIGNGCGNGGFSLRKVNTMIKVIKNNAHSRHPEDVFFAKANNLKLPSKDLQKAFSVEQIAHDNPIGCHKFLTKKLYMKMFPNHVHTIQFGASKKNVKRVLLPQNIIKRHHTIILKSNKYPDRFNFKIENKFLVIRRTDRNHGWNYKHICHILT